jgi:hypothetical protein
MKTYSGVPDAHKEAVLVTQRLARTPMSRPEIVALDVLLREPALQDVERPVLRHAAYRLEFLEEHAANDAHTIEQLRMQLFDPPVPVDIDRLKRQRSVSEWCTRAFGPGHASSIPQRAVRFLEESIEAAQAAGVERSMAHRLIDYVFNRMPGTLSQELGGIGVTLLALAEAAGLDAEVEEVLEIRRVMSTPLEHFRERNAVKNEAGFEVTT